MVKRRVYGLFMSRQNFLKFPLDIDTLKQYTTYKPRGAVFYRPAL